MTATHRIALLALVTASAWLIAPAARASDSYPHVIENALDTPCPPACTTCHTSASGGVLTANKPLGISVRRAGLECCNPGQLLDVLAELESSGTDSDADGTPDTDELRAGTDPNASEGNFECLPPETEEGCAITARSTHSRESALFSVAAVLACAVVARVRRRARARPCQ